MDLLNDIAELGRLRGPLHLAIGVFDGVHLGHQAVIEAARRTPGEAAAERAGLPVAVTFDPHPVEVLAPGSAPRLLTSTAHKLRLLERVAKVRCACVVTFDEAFSRLTGEAFVEQFVEASRRADGVASVSVGEDWLFGARRSGDVALLRRLGEKHGFEVNAVPTVAAEGMRVSSTRIREAVGAGDFEIARALLGRSYTVYGTVIEGRRLGRTIGFPTANFTVHREQLPPTGVYAVRATGAGDGWDGVANLGYRPTVEDGETRRLLEVHLFGLDHEIYGEDLEVEFVRFLRPEQKFDGIEALKAQIAADAAAAREALAASL